MQSAESGNENNSAQSAENAREQFILDRMNEALEEYHLTPFSMEIAKAWLKDCLCKCLESEESNNNLVHMKGWLVQKLNKKKRDLGRFSPWQSGCPELIPELTHKTFWDTSSFVWVKKLEEFYPVIKQELLQLKGKKGFQQYRSPNTNSSQSHDKANNTNDERIGVVSHDKGDWNVYYLYLHNMDFKENRAQVPKTIEAIDSCVPRSYTHAFFSAVAPQTHITKHHGPTNKKLRCHLPIIVPNENGSCRIRVGEDIKEFEEGKCIIFDDSHEHEVWNDSPDSSRIVLIVDLWHPDLLEKEVKFFEFLQKSQMRAGKKFSEASQQKQKQKENTQSNDGTPIVIGEDFFEIIENGHKKGANEEMIWSLPA